MALKKTLLSSVNKNVCRLANNISHQITLSIPLGRLKRRRDLLPATKYSLLFINVVAQRSAREPRKQYKEFKESVHT